MRRFRLLPLYYFNKRLFCNDISSLSESSARLQLKHVDLIKEFTGCPIDQVRRAVSRRLELQYLSEQEVLHKLKLLESLDIYDLRSVNIVPLLLKHPISLKNYHSSLCEYSFIPFLIQAYQIKRFTSTCRKSVKELKERGFIEDNSDVMRNLWRHAELDMGSCPEVTDFQSLHDLKALAIRAFFKEKLGTSDEDIDKQNSEINLRLLNKSFKTINANLSLFRDNIMLSKERIFLNWYIFGTNYESNREILSRFPYIGSTDMRICLHIFPKICSMPIENMDKMLRYLEEEGIPIKALERFPVLLTLNCESVKERLKELKSIEALSVYQKHPSIAKLLVHQVRAKRRMSILQELKILCTMHYLVSSEKQFERICESQRVSGSDALHYLKIELNLDKREILFKIRRHKRWRFVPVVEVAKNLRYLRKIFNDKEIIDNLYILFYYNGRVLQELEKVEHLESMEEFKRDGQIKKEFILPLTIYFLEKEFNFTGESVWETPVINPYQDLPDRPEIKVSSL